ncbi:MAG: Gfo/Idh/MocA family oxidoreductase [bacterium]
MEILIIGYSSIARRRVIPALLSLKNIEKIHLATRQNPIENIIPLEKRGDVYHDYGEAISKYRGELVYVSLPNSMHAEWIRQALNKRFHVMVDKPAVINLADAENMVEYAQRNKLCLAEANVWSYHPLTKILRKMISEDNKPLLSITATFTSPPLEPNNFRYNPELGSGIILDRGSYAVSCSRIFFGKKPIEIISRITSSNMNGVDTSFSLMMIYDSGSVLQGFFSLEAEYKNSISCIGQSYYFETERIFTPPADIELVINVKRGNRTQQLTIEKGDSFALFIDDVLTSIKNNSFQRFAKILLEDAQLLEIIRNLPHKAM